MTQKEISAVGARIAKLRGNQTQEELAAQLYVTREKLSMWEQGRRMLKAPDIKQLADHFRVSADYLLSGVESEQMNIHRELGLSQTAIEALQQFKIDDVIKGSKDPAGKCEALSTALSCRPLLEVIATLLMLKHSEPGLFEGMMPVDGGRFYEGKLSPDAYAGALTFRLSLILESLRKGEGGELSDYKPWVRVMDAFKSDPANLSAFQRKKKARDKMAEDLRCLDQEIKELEGDSNG